MDCNREEAMRAKDIAEKKMASKDFAGARKIALKAQQLYPEIENISRMLIVCEVYCSAAKKLAGDDLDWYSILQIEKTADEAAIKKQYKKFALQLHPDKNKFSGAEGAFKLITQAQGTLLDKDKRRQHDMRHGSGFHRPPHTANWNANRTHQSHAASAPFQAQTQRPVHPDPKLTFWTGCPFCQMKFQYFRDVMLRSLQCQSCQKPFVAYDINASRPSVSLNKPVFPKAKSAFNVEVRVQRNSGTGNSNLNSKVDPGQKPDAGTGTAKAEGTAAKVNLGREKNRVKKRSRVIDSESESSDLEVSSDSEEEIEVDENGDLKDGENSGQPRDQNVRRSSRQKQQVSYQEKEVLSDEDLNDDENGRASKKAKKEKRAAEEDNREEERARKSPVEVVVEEISEDQQDGDLGSEVDEDEDEEKASESLFSYPDPEFNDFEKGRAKECFEAEQIWAAYDDKGAMPRFFVKIMKVISISPVFKLVITWLEPDPIDGNEKKWNAVDLPFSCGNFKYGEMDTTENHPMFSHRVIDFAKGSRKNTFLIRPRKGEVWAIFKDWDIKWTRHGKTEFEFDFVEILSDNSDGAGIHVALLSKVDGFVSLFDRTTDMGKRTFLIPPGELLRFSHMIPSFKMKGDEGKGVPEGCFELDPASLPAEIFKSLPKPAATGFDDEAKGKKKNDPSSASAPDEIEYPETEFYDFDAEKSEDKFQAGQIWALYSDEDQYPKYYCEIWKVERTLGFKLHILWLTSAGLGSNVVKWSDPSLPVSCGRFRPRGTKNSQAYESTSCFSHLVRTTQTLDKQTHYIIRPRIDEVWALYRDWSPDLKIAGPESCEYDIVEVVSEDDFKIRVLELERVKGYNTVFKPRVPREERSVLKIEILRFSHQIPAFRLAREKFGKVRGFWELDSAAVPIQYFRSK